MKILSTDHGIVFSRTAETFTKLMLFYFLLVATSLSPSPFVAGNEHVFAVYCILALIYSLFLAVFWSAGRTGRNEGDSVVGVVSSSEEATAATEDSPVIKCMVRDFLLIFVAIAVLLGAIEILHFLFGSVAPMPLTDIPVLASITVLSLFASILSNAVFRSTD